MWCSNQKLNVFELNILTSGSVNHLKAVIQREETWFWVLLPSANKKYSEQEGCGLIAKCLVLKHFLSSDLRK